MSRAIPLLRVGEPGPVVAPATTNPLLSMTASWTKHFGLGDFIYAQFQQQQTASPLIIRTIIR